VKAVVLARGLGTRMKTPDDGASLSPEEARIADTGVKALVPLSEDRPLLDYILSALADAGATDICLVIGPEHRSIRERYTKIAPPRRFRITFAVQERPLGTADALLSAEEFVAGQEFLALNSDNYYPVSALRTLVELGRPGTVLFRPEALAARSNIEPGRIRAFALGHAGADGCLDSLIEKPDAEILPEIGSGRLVSMNLWRLPTRIFDVCRRLVPSARGELELPEAIATTIAEGVRLRVIVSDEGVLDLSKRSDISTVKERLRGVVVKL
jgi:glucose-1-phosphate thymidylyltransferase